ncbi:Fic family protein [Marinomonas flavescens]|uniref:Fic family protein n=1 Tax=Marinomonas flavescens TaxID=2529379 RepID=UPI0010560551|nr:Fic family protein [Marinomonas flavescens]
MISVTPFIQPEQASGDIRDMAVEVYKQSASLSASVRPNLKPAVEHLLRFVNSYYSNRIEGNSTEPADIIHAEGIVLTDSVKRNDLLEIDAHLAAQNALLKGSVSPAQLTDEAFLCSIHEHFFKDLPESVRTHVRESTGEIYLVEAGKLRTTQVQIGKHLPPHQDELNGYLNWFHSSYRLDRLFGETRLLAASAAHHRFAWIHPFLDGNGRVGRLFTDSYMRGAGVDGYGLWTLSRGFARTIDEYKLRLAGADMVRQGSTDGRGILSNRGLEAFQRYFFETCLDQIQYLAGVLDIPSFDMRLKQYTDQRVSGVALSPKGETLKKWRPETVLLLKAVMTDSKVMRTDVPQITGLGDTNSRAVVKQLIEEGWIRGETKTALKINQIPFDAISFLFPHLW